MNALIKILGGLILSGAILGIGKYIRHINSENSRLMRNQNALIAGMTIVEDRYRQQVAKVEALELSNAEFKRLNNDLMHTVDALNLKIGRLESLSQAIVVTVDTVRVQLDSAVVRRDVSGSVIEHPFYFDDGFSRINGQLTLRDDNKPVLDLNYQMTDTLDVILYRVPKHFLFIPYGIKRMECYLKSRNPKSMVTVGTCVIRKKR